MPKYGNRKTEIGGIVFDSRWEALLFAQLVLLKKGGLIEDLARQVRFPLRVAEKPICAIVVDFTYLEKGKKVVHEAKGFRTRDWVLKWKLAQALYPDWEFRIN